MDRPSMRTGCRRTPLSRIFPMARSAFTRLCSTGTYSFHPYAMSLSSGLGTVHVQGHGGHELLVVHLREKGLPAGIEQVPRHGGLFLDQRGDLLLHRALADEQMDQHVLLLADPECTVGGLVFHRRIPPSVEVNDVG